MERERQRERRRPQPPVEGGPEIRPPRDVGDVARGAAADAEPVGSGSVTVQVRTTTRDAGRVDFQVTPDTPVQEIFDRACADLGVTDRDRYALVAGGEVLGDLGSPISELLAERVDENLAMRLVRRPEAGG